MEDLFVVDYAGKDLEFISKGQMKNGQLTKLKEPGFPKRKINVIQQLNLFSNLNLKQHEIYIFNLISTI